MNIIKNVINHGTHPLNIIYVECYIMLIIFKYNYNIWIIHQNQINDKNQINKQN